MNKLILHKSSNMETHYGIASSDYIDAAYLTATVEGTATVPARAGLVIMTATADFYFRYGATVALPAAAVTNGSAGELNPIMRMVVAAGVIHLISPWACVVTLAYYL